MTDLELDDRMFNSRKSNSRDRYNIRYKLTETTVIQLENRAHTNRKHIIQW